MLYFTPQTILKEELPSNPSAIVVDECDMFASPLFVASKRSKCSEKLFNYIKANPETHVLLCSATVIRSSPWNFHTLLTYVGRYVDWKIYRERYFSLEHKPYLPRPAWLPRMGWQKMMQPLINTNCVTALMVDILPDDKKPIEEHKIIKLKEPNYEKNTEWTAQASFVADHRMEQDKKHLEIERIAKGYKKVVIVAHYREQIDDLTKRLSTGRECFVLHGGVKNHEEIKQAAKDSTECYVIIQNALGVGINELADFPAMIFASQGYSARNYTQMIGRIARSDDLLKRKGPKYLKYYYLQAGRCDRMVYSSVRKGEDFIPSRYLLDRDNI